MISITQDSKDGFGHQLHGLITVMSFHNVSNYYFDGHYFINKHFNFEHIDKNEKNYATKYLIYSVNLFLNYFNENQKIYSNVVHSHEIYKIPKNYSQTTLYKLDNVFYTNKSKLNKIEKKQQINNLNIIKSFFFNKYIVNNLKENNIVFHFRLGDCYKGKKKKIIDRYNKKIILLLERFSKKYTNYTYYFHTNGDIKNITEKADSLNIDYKVFKKNTNILEVFSDFINSKIFIGGVSSLSTIATFLNKNDLTIVYDEIKHDIPNHVIKISNYLNQ